MVALLALLPHLTLGDSMVGLRILPALTTAGVVLSAALLAREPGGGHFAQALIWVWALILLVRLLRDGPGKDRLWLGLVLGIGLETKITVLY